MNRGDTIVAQIMKTSPGPENDVSRWLYDKMAADGAPQFLFEKVTIYRYCFELCGGTKWH